MMQINREEVYEEYMRKVDQIAEDCDWVTHIGPKTLVNLVIDVIEKSQIKTNSMKTFKDIEFKEHPMGSEFGILSKTMFDNGYGVSVVKSQYTYGGTMDLYEMAVLDSDGHVTYITSITDDVVGYLTEEDVTEWMQKVQELKNN
jgi:hypothetical protein